jgi:Ti-type conjugative transfer relaxase TraA
MAIYHLSVKVHSRKSGKSIVAAAAYRAGQSLEEEQTGITHNYTRKQGVEYSEILAPEGSPDWVFDRSRLWNAVEATEKRKDSQLAREVEVGLPIELGKAEQEALLREYVQREFVSKGMVADFSIHRDDENNPHAHILLTMRSVTKEGFGPKMRGWNERAKLMDWRQGWEEVTNEHLARAGLAVRIDHRTLKAQGLDLEPGRKIGVSRERQTGGALPFRIADRVAEQAEIARENGQKIVADPGLALKALTHGQATFSHRDIAKYLHTRTEASEQFQAALLKVTTSKELVSLGRDDRGQERFTSREMLELERQVLEQAEDLHGRGGHGMGDSRVAAVKSQHSLTDEQVLAYEELTAKGDLKLLVGVAGSGKSRMLAAAREAWEAEGYTVKGAALSGIAAENLATASGIQSRTLASFEYGWKQDRDPLTSKDVLVIDEAGMVGTRQLARVIQAAHDARAKVVLVGDPEQLQAIEAGAPFRGIAARHGVSQLNQVQRQRHAWQREATQELAKGQTVDALARYAGQGGVVQVATRALARDAMLARWAKDSQTLPAESRLMLAYTRDDVRELNLAARALRQQRGELGLQASIETARGIRPMAAGDRVYFLRNEKSLGVRNGSLGTIEAMADNVIQVRLDSEDRRVAVDTRFYNDLDYGYAATVYKAQGTTVDRTYLLATAHYDRHATYVGLSRHRESATVFYATEDFGAPPENRTQSEALQERMFAVLSRARPKELVHDYLERDLDRTDPMRGPRESEQEYPATPKTRQRGRAAKRGRLERESQGIARAIPDLSADIRVAIQARDRQSEPRKSLEEIQAEARERWLADREGSRGNHDPSIDLEAIRRQGREDWLALRAKVGAEQTPMPSAPAPTSELHRQIETLASGSQQGQKGQTSELDLSQIKSEGRRALKGLKQELQREDEAKRAREQELEQQRKLEREKQRGLGPRGRGRGRGRDGPDF